MNTDNSGPAFPSNRDMAHDSKYDYAPGMTMRDYFAAKAMQAAATNPVGAEGFTFTERAVWAYQQADAMLAARAKP